MGSGGRWVEEERRREMVADRAAPPLETRKKGSVGRGGSDESVTSSRVGLW